jgi:hypothetical protein
LASLDTVFVSGVSSDVVSVSGVSLTSNDMADFVSSLLVLDTVSVLGCSLVFSYVFRSF